MQYGFGIDLGGTTVKLAYFNENGTILDKWEIPTDTSCEGSHILPHIGQAVTQYLEANHICRDRVIGIGIGVPGPVTPAGVVNRCINLGWGTVNVVQELSKLTGMPVKAGNDANVAALGECWLGGGKGCSNMVLVTLGTGVGGGIIIDGKLLFGANGAGGEIGHLTMNKGETSPCACGRYGCVEQYCSATGIVRSAKKHLAETTCPSSLRHITELTCKDIFDAANAGDAAAKEILETVYDQLADFISGICCVIDPEVVVIGGGVSKAGDILLQGIEKHLRKYIFHANTSVKLALAQLGNDAGAYGAFKLLLDSKA